MGGMIQKEVVWFWILVVGAFINFAFAAFRFFYEGRLVSASWFNLAAGVFCAFVAYRYYRDL